VAAEQTPQVGATRTDAAARDDTAAWGAGRDGRRADGTGAGAAGAARVRELPMARAINKGLHDVLAADDRVLLYGEDVGALGGVFTVTAGLQREFGVRRVYDSPLAESGLVGTAIGLAMRGWRPIVEIQFDGFVFPAFNQITSQLARQTNRHEGSLSMPVVIRLPYGGGVGAIEHHQESPEAYFAHTPGLRVVAPATANDAYWMIRQAVASDDPVVFLEPKRRYWQKGPVSFEAPPAGLHRSRVVRPGDRVTLIGWGSMVPVMLDAAEIADGEGVSVEVVDIRSISPIDYGPIVESVERTGHAVVVAEAPGAVSVASEIAAQLAERAFYSLEAPVARVTGFDVPFPPARLEGSYVPDADRVLDAVDRVLEY
jgi:2-oxoisovalerate dehydrogenase E1 component beta subunit